jgi:hypothetical protein
MGSGSRFGGSGSRPVGGGAISRSWVLPVNELLVDFWLALSILGTTRSLLRGGGAIGSLFPGLISGGGTKSRS